MAVKKPAAKKVAAKKSAPAKKTAAKKSAPAKKSVSKSAAPKVDPLDEIAKEICEGIVSGAFDFALVQFDDALEERLSKQQQAAAKKTPAKKSPVADTKKVSAPPKRAAKVKPEAEKTYQIASKFKSLSGAKVKFKRFKADDENKSVVEMLTDKPGAPKGKRVVVPTTALEPVASPAKKRAAKK